MILPHHRQHLLSLLGINWMICRSWLFWESYVLIRYLPPFFLYTHLTSLLYISLYIVILLTAVVHCYTTHYCCTLLYYSLLLYIVIHTTRCRLYQLFKITLLRTLELSLLNLQPLTYPYHLLTPCTLLLWYLYSLLVLTQWLACTSLQKRKVCTT